MTAPGTNPRQARSGADILSAVRSALTCAVCEKQVIQEGSPNRFYTQYFRNFCSFACLGQHHHQATFKRCFRLQCDKPMNSLNNEHCLVDTGTFLSGQASIYIFDTEACLEQTFQDDFCRQCHACGQIFQPDPNLENEIYCSAECNKNMAIIDMERNDFADKKCNVDRCKGKKVKRMENRGLSFHYGNFCSMDHSMERCNLLRNTLERLSYCAGCPKSLPYPQSVLRQLPEDIRAHFPQEYVGRCAEYKALFGKDRDVVIPLLIDQRRFIGFCTDDCYLAYCKQMVNEQMVCSLEECPRKSGNAPRRSMAAFIQIYKSTRLEKQFCTFRCLLTFVEKKSHKISTISDDCQLCELGSNSNQSTSTRTASKALNLCQLHQSLFTNFEHLVPLSETTKESKKVDKENQKVDKENQKLEQPITEFTQLLGNQISVITDVPSPVLEGAEDDVDVDGQPQSPLALLTPTIENQQTPLDLKVNKDPKPDMTSINAPLPPTQAPTDAVLKTKDVTTRPSVIMAPSSVQPMLRTQATDEQNALLRPEAIDWTTPVRARPSYSQLPVSSRPLKKRIFSFIDEDPKRFETNLYPTIRPFTFESKILCNYALQQDLRCSQTPNLLDPNAYDLSKSARKIQIFSALPTGYSVALKGHILPASDEMLRKSLCKEHLRSLKSLNIYLGPDGAESKKPKRD